MAYQDGLRQGFTGLDPLAALGAPVTALLGVSGGATNALGALGISTVFDLATAPVFEVAREVAEIAAGRGSSAMARLGMVPGGLLDPGQALAPEVLAAAPVASLLAISDALAVTMASELQVETIGELGRWAPFRAAQQVLSATTQLPDDAVDGAAAGAGELVPRLGDFPTERRYYRSVIIDHVATGDTTDLTTAGPIDIAPTVGAGFGFGAPAIGARLTLLQSWFAHGITLGNLLHSVALAPGESTRIAMLDWSRQTSATATEAISETEQLTQTTGHNRAVSEVQDATAQEVQSGFSGTSSDATTTSGGGGLGLSLGPLTLGATGSGSHTTSGASSFSASAGSRNLAASMNQKVMDATQQAASSVRDRRASKVMEVSEREHEAVSTRIVANYNHMHALTVQYFEVVELYRVSVQLHQVERCLFVPMSLVTFTDDLIAHYQAVLADAALDRRAQELLTTEYGMVRVQSVLPMRRPANLFDHLRALDGAAVISSTATPPNTPAPSNTVTPPASAAPPPASSPAAATPAAVPALAAWSTDEMARAARIIAAGPARPGTSDLFLPDDTELVGVSFASTAPAGAPVPLNAVQVRLRTGQTSDLASVGPIDWSASTPLPLGDLEDVRVSSASAQQFDGRMTLQLSYRGARFPLTLPLSVGPQASLTTVLTIGAPESGAELQDHLQRFRLHYSQAIWRALDPSSIALLLSAYTFEDLPVADLIDPNPIMVAGNFLVFRMPGFAKVAGLVEPADADAASGPEAAIRTSWEAWLKTRGLVLGADVAAEELVPVPTGGVFAEAVLGRSNAAELLDVTRFWNWQDSPIPLQPPEIAAIQMQSRAQSVDPTPGQLGQPVLNIVNPTALPDPTGLGPMLGALQSGGMFRDMSGLAATVGLAQALGQATSTAATDAGKQAAANLAVAAQKDIEEKRIAAQLALAAIGMPGGNAGTPKNISESGALLNTAKAMDNQSARSPGAATATGGSASNGGGSPLMPGAGDALSGGLTNGSRADNVLNRITWGNLGVAGADVVPASLTVDGGVGGGGDPAAVSVEPFPATAAALSTPDNEFLQLDKKLNNAVAGSPDPADPPGLSQDPDTKDMCVAVVDLRPRPDSDGLFQGYNVDDMLYVGSLQKISPMYAAYELRARVRQHVKTAVAAGLTADATGWKKMRADLKAAWQPKLSANFPALPPGFPNLDNIFTVTSPDHVDFSTSFSNSLTKMVQWSDDEEAMNCILALSYPYINGLLRATGLFRPASVLDQAKGLWISGNYHHGPTDWKPDYTADDANAGQLKTARWQTPKRPKTNFGATARQVARLFALIAADRLVDDPTNPNVNSEIRDLLGLATSGAGSFIEQFLSANGRPFDNVFSKIGVGDDGYRHDGGIVEHTVGGTKSRYVVVALGAANHGNAGTRLSKVFSRVDIALS